MHNHISWAGVDIHAGEKADVKVPTWQGCMLSAVVRQAGYTAKISETGDSLDIVVF